MKQGSMIQAFREFKGNARMCLILEPLWGVPYNLYMPYIALFMRNLGLTVGQIGMVASILMVSQFFFAVMSGVLTDKLGRRKCTFIFDCLAWAVPELLWACSQSVEWFIVAAIFNGAERVTTNSWGLLLVEDTREEQVVKAFSLTQMMGLLAAFFAPLSGLFVHWYGVVPTMRVLYLIAFVSMTLKFIALYLGSRETQMGEQRMAETKNQSMFSLLWGCKEVFLKNIRTRRMLLTIGICAVYQIISAINSNFWALLVNERIGIPESNVVVFTTIKSVITLLCIALIVPRISSARFKRPMLTGWSLLICSQLLLILAPAGWMAVPMLLASVCMEAAALSVMTPMVDSLLFINADARERARVLGMVYAAILVPVSIFPALAGQLAGVSIVIPFVLNLILFALGAALTVNLWKEVRGKECGTEKLQG